MRFSFPECWRRRFRKNLPKPISHFSIGTCRPALHIRSLAHLSIAKRHASQFWEMWTGCTFREMCSSTIFGESEFQWNGFCQGAQNATVSYPRGPEKSRGTPWSQIRQFFIFSFQIWRFPSRRRFRRVQLKKNLGVNFFCCWIKKNFKNSKKSINLGLIS